MVMLFIHEGSYLKIAIIDVNMPMISLFDVLHRFKKKPVFPVSVSSSTGAFILTPALVMLTPQFWTTQGCQKITSILQLLYCWETPVKSVCNTQKKGDNPY